MLIKYFTVLYSILLIFCFSLSGFGETAEEILIAIESSLFPSNFYMKTELKTTKPRNKDSGMVLDVYKKNNEGCFFSIISASSARFIGMRFLQQGKNLWMYNPHSKSNRAIRLSPREFFQGTLFSNNDIGDPTYSDDYIAVISDSVVYTLDELNNPECYIIELSAKDKHTTYARLKMWVTKKTHIPLKIEYYSKADVLFKVTYFSGIKKMAGELRPTVYTMRSMEIQDMVSILTVIELEERNNLPGSMFTQTYLKKQ